MYLRARYLNPRLGVFGSRNPFAGESRNPLSLNRYSWVQGNVPNLNDPTGHNPFLILASLINVIKHNTQATPTNTPTLTPFYITTTPTSTPSATLTPSATPTPILIPTASKTPEWYSQMLKERESGYEDLGPLAIGGLLGIAAVATLPAWALITIGIPFVAGSGASIIQQVGDAASNPQNGDSSLLEILGNINFGEATLSGLYGVGVAGTFILSRGASFISSISGVATQYIESTIIQQPSSVLEYLSSAFWGASTGIIVKGGSRLAPDKFLEEVIGVFLGTWPTHFSMEIQDVVDTWIAEGAPFTLPEDSILNLAQSFRYGTSSAVGGLSTLIIDERLAFGIAVSTELLLQLLIKFVEESPQ